MELLEHFIKRKSYSHLIWDWNGTLLDDVLICNEILCEFLTEQGLPKISLEQHRELFGFPIFEFYKKVGFDLTETSYSIMAEKYSQTYRNRVHRCQLFAGVENFLESTKTRSYSHSVLSAALQTDLISQLKYYKIYNFFDYIYGLNNNLAAGKLERGRELIRDSGIALSKTLLIGDTDHDLEVGQKLGIDVLLIADGHQSCSRLSAIHDQVIATKNTRQRATNFCN